MRHATLSAVLVFLLVAAHSGAGIAGDSALDAMTFGDGAPGFSGFDIKEKPLLKAAVLSETASFSPGTPFNILVELDHSAGAYTYWKNPGGPGVGTTIAWQLPPGFSISEAKWPAPQKYQTGTITSYIYKNRIAVLFTVTPSADFKPGDTFALEGKLSTQVCTSRSCNPLHLPIRLDVAASEQPGTPNPAYAKALGVLPSAPRDWRFEAAEYGNELVIAMFPAPGANPSPEGLYFFDAGSPSPLVDSQLPQNVEREGEVWWLRIPRLEGQSRVGGRVEGVLYAANGWLAGDSGQTGFAVDLPVTAEGTGRPPGLQRPVEQRTGVLLFFAFLGGLILNVMPCVFPVIGLKIMGFAKQAHKDRRAVFLHGLSYTAGVLLCFWTLAFLVITMGRGWGAQLQSDWFMFALCHVFVIMSMNMAGAFEIGATAASVGQSLTGREGLKRSFFTGLLATITSTPCSAPFLGTALAYALSLPALMSLGVFTLMGVGFSFPYLALSLFPGWLKRLPKPGPWMDTFRQAMCFPLFATTAYLFWTMEAMLEEWHFLMLLFGLVLTAMACWLYGKSQKAAARSLRAGRVVITLAVMSLVCGLWLGMPKLSDSELQWGEWSPEAVAKLRDEGRPVYVDFTARWCATCQLNKRVYQDEEVADLLREKNVALLKADWTLYDERITRVLRNEFNKAAVPVTVLYAPGTGQGKLLPEILTADNVATAVRALPDRVAMKK